ncbi:lysophospholipid acyltransferase family protein [Candidatus Binatia bacterium]|nr:lysophospholipid acyltransferase family protein [Candidatus Binatia bacterium]
MGGSTGRRRWWREGFFLWLLMELGPRAISGGLRLLQLTVRVELLRAEALLRRWESREQSIIAFWHNRLVMMPIPYRGGKLCIMNSQSRDGEIATRALARWGIHSVRGSASRGGARGFLQLVRAYRDGYDLAVVPDGPRGPRYVAKAGVIHLARVTGAPIYPVSFAATRRRRLRSWDRLILPLPFARVVYVVGEPLHVPREATDDEVEGLRAELEARLNAITREAEARVGNAFDGDGAAAP